MTLYLSYSVTCLPKLGQPRPNSVNIRRGWAVCNSSQEPWLLEARVFKESLLETVVTCVGAAAGLQLRDHLLRVQPRPEQGPWFFIKAPPQYIA